MQGVTYGRVIGNSTDLLNPAKLLLNMLINLTVFWLLFIFLPKHLNSFKQIMGRDKHNQRAIIRNPLQSYTQCMQLVPKHVTQYIYIYIYIYVYIYTYIYIYIYIYIILYIRVYAGNSPANIPPWCNHRIRLTDVRLLLIMHIFATSPAITAGMTTRHQERGMPSRRECSKHHALGQRVPPSRLER